MRGDRPFPSLTSLTISSFTPHARGSTPDSRIRTNISPVYPACAGIDPEAGELVFVEFGLPRMRGDRPMLISSLFFVAEFTPHARGSTPMILRQFSQIPVYPACAGIDRVPLHSLIAFFCLPRMRGDRPTTESGPWPLEAFTPHARGSTLHWSARVFCNFVYPACAGIDHRMRGYGYIGNSLPRMRGDRPLHGDHAEDGLLFTPHARGSTPAGVLQSR